MDYSQRRWSRGKKKKILKKTLINQLSWTPLLSRTLLHMFLPSKSLNSQTVLSWSLGLWRCYCSLLSRSWTPPSRGHCSLCCALPPLFVHTRFSRMSPLLSSSVTFLMKLSSIHSTNLLDWWCLVVFLFQQTATWLRCPIQTDVCKNENASSCLKKTLCTSSCSSDLWQTVTTASPSLVFPLILSHPKAELHAFSLLSHIEDNSSSSPCPACPS